MALLPLIPALGWSQAGDELEALLGSRALTYGQAARFVLEAAGAAALPGPGEALAYAKERNFLPRNAAEGAPARLDGVSLLLMRAFDLRGGLFYSLAKSPHYAYREMIYKQVIQDRADPSMPVSGDLLLFMVGRILGPREEAALSQPAIRRKEKLAKDINLRLKALRVENASASVTGEGVVISLSDIRFLPDSPVLEESEQAKLREIARILREFRGMKISVAGHTALAGTPEGQRRISLERAQAVASYLAVRGVGAGGEIVAFGYGADRPVADNSSPEGMAQNRRVEIIILED
jgi:outer membrane protein OmpA-like peptidoglycan-associated protein